MNTPKLTEKEAAKLAAWRSWGQKMALARELLDAAKSKSAERDTAFYSHRKTAF